MVRQVLAACYQREGQEGERGSYRRTANSKTWAHRFAYHPWQPLFPVYFSVTIVEVNVNQPIMLSDISVEIINDDWHTKGTKRRSWLKRIDLDLDLNLKHVGFGCNKKQSLHFEHSTQMPKMQ